MIINLTSDIIISINEKLLFIINNLCISAMNLYVNEYNKWIIFMEEWKKFSETQILLRIHIHMF